MTSRSLVPLLLLILTGCRSTAVPEVAVDHDCPLIVRLPSNVFETSGLVRPVFDGLGEIEGGFEVRRITAGSPALPRTQRRPGWRGAPRPYPLSFCLPETAWRPLGHRIDDSSYEIDPGTYQLVVTYRAVVSRATCVAASDVFLVKRASLWVVTD